MLSNGVSSIIFKVFGMTQPGIEPRFPGPLPYYLCIARWRIVGYLTFPKVLGLSEIQTA